MSVLDGFVVVATRVLMSRGYGLRVIDRPGAEDRYAITDGREGRLLGGETYEGSLTEGDVLVFASTVAEKCTFSEALAAMTDAVDRIESEGDLLHRGVAYDRDGK